MSKKTGKEALLLWCQQRTAPFGLKVTNFHSDWKDGLGFGALVVYFCPGTHRTSQAHTAGRLRLCFC